MESKKFTAMLAVIVPPRVVDLIITRRGMGRHEAIDSFFRSRTFEALSNQYTDVCGITAR